jgi:hypothetical protein
MLVWCITSNNLEEEQQTEDAGHCRQEMEAENLA